MILREPALMWTGNDGRSFPVILDAPTFVVMRVIDRHGHGADDDAIGCKRCGMTSFNANDVANRYCGHCHQFHQFITRDELTVTTPAM